MPPLPDSYHFDPPLDFRTRTSNVTYSDLHTRLLWAGLKPGTRDIYSTAVRSFEAFCGYHKSAAWPATFEMLSQWVVGRAYGAHASYIPRQGQLQSTTISSYLAALRSVHTDRNEPTEVFDNPHIKRLVQGAANLFPRAAKTKRLPLTKQMLTSMLSPNACRDEHPQDTLNLNAAFTLAFSGFLRMGEFTWDPKEVNDLVAFSIRRPTRRCITPSEDHYLFYLPQSKSDKANVGVQISLLASHNLTCPVRHMNALLASNQATTSPTSPLFDLHNGPFTRKEVLKLMANRLRRLGYDAARFTGHSFRKGAAQNATEMGLSKEEIMVLGRWASEAVTRYYRDDNSYRMALQYRCHTGRNIPYLTT